jgi:hypothetical protein
MLSSSLDIECDVLFLSWDRIWCYLSLLTRNITSSPSPDIKSGGIFLSWDEISFHLPQHL